MGGITTTVAGTEAAVYIHFCINTKPSASAYPLAMYMWRTLLEMWVANNGRVRPGLVFEMYEGGAAIFPILELTLYNSYVSCVSLQVFFLNKNAIPMPSLQFSDVTHRRSALRVIDAVALQLFHI